MSTGCGGLRTVVTADKVGRAAEVDVEVLKAMRKSCWLNGAVGDMVHRRKVFLRTVSRLCIKGGIHARGGRRHETSSLSRVDISVYLIHDMLAIERRSMSCDVSR